MRWCSDPDNKLSEFKSVSLLHIMQFSSLCRWSWKSTRTPTFTLPLSSTPFLSCPSINHYLISSFLKIMKIMKGTTCVNYLIHYFVQPMQGIKKWPILYFKIQQNYINFHWSQGNGQRPTQSRTIVVGWKRSTVCLMKYRAQTKEI